MAISRLHTATRRVLTLLVLVIALAVPFGVPIWAQTETGSDEVAEGSDDNGFIINQIEKQLSTDSRKIRLSGVEGALSRQARIARITISDREGVWLQIDDAVIDWNRSALLRGAIEIERLGAARITISRPPMAEPSLPKPGARSFSAPDLPVSVRLNDLDVPSFIIGEPVFGTATELAVNGRVNIISESVDSALRIRRLDGPGGEFNLIGTFDDDSNVVNVDLSVSEPANGVVANLLDIPGLPSVALSIQANGPVTDLTATVDLKTNDEDVVDGLIRITQNDDELIGFEADLSGRLQDLVDQQYSQFFGDTSSIQAAGRQRPEGGFVLDSFALDTGGLRLAGGLSTLPDGFLETLDITGALGAPDGSRLVLPVPGGETSVASGDLSLTYGAGDRWRGRLLVDDLIAGDTRIEDIRLRMGGVAANLNDPENRRVGIRLTGAVSGISSGDLSMDEVVGRQIGLRLSADWTSGASFEIAEALIDGPGFDLSLVGKVEDLGFDGRAAINVLDLATYSGLVGRDLSGSLSTSIEGRIDPIQQGFDLTFAGAAQDVIFGVEAVDGLFAGSTQLTGGLARDTNGFRADGFSFANDQFQLTVDGLYAEEGSDLRLAGALRDIGLVTNDASGAVTIDVTTGGGQDELTLDARVALADGIIQGNPVENAQIILSGAGSSVDSLVGEIRGGALLGDTPLVLSGALTLKDGIQALRGFTLRAGETAIDGTLIRGFDGLVAGRLDVVSPDLSKVAALAGQAAEGAVDVRVTLFRNSGKQGASVRGQVDGLQVAGARLDEADLNLQVRDVLGAPLLDGTLTAAGAAYNETVLENLRLTSALTDDTMRLSADASLDTGVRVVLETDLSRIEGGYGLGLDQLEVTSDIANARLLAPADVTIIGSRVTTTPLQLGIGDGSLTVSGVVDEVVDMTVSLRNIDLAIANAFAPDLAVAGVLDGAAYVTGPRFQPDAVFNFTGRGISAAPLVAAGLPPVDLDARGQTAGNAVELVASVLGGDVVGVTATGTVPFDPFEEAVAIDLAIDRLEIGIFDRFAGSPGLDGQVTGTARITGTLPLPNAVFDLKGTGLAAPKILGAAMPPLDLTAEGRLEDALLTLDGLLEGGPQVGVTLNGSVPLDPFTDAMDLSVVLDRLDIAVVDELAGGLGLAGQVTGTAQVTGTLPLPDAVFDLKGTGIAAPKIVGAAMPPLDLTAEGRLEDALLTLDAALEGGPQVGMTLKGTVPIDPFTDAMDLSVVLDRLDVAVVDELAGGLGLAGQVTGTAQVTGMLPLPSLVFDVAATDLAAPGIAGATMPPLNLTANGRNQGEVLTIDAAIEGGALVGVTIVGTVPLDPFTNEIDVNVAIDRLDIAILDALVGEQGLAGQVTGTAQIKGKLPLPAATFDISGTDLTANPVADAGLPSLTLTARGQTVADILSIEADLTGGTALGVSVTGDIPLNPEAEGLAVNVALDNLQLAVLDQLAGNQGLRGSVTGSATLTGSVAEPMAEYSARGTGLATTTTIQNGIPGIEIALAGAFAEDVVTIAGLTARGPRNLAFNATGEIPLRGPGLNISVRGQVPLILANIPLARAQVQLDGEADVSADIGGSLSRPTFNGRVGITGGRIVAPARNVSLENLTLDARLSGTQLTLATLTAELNGGGTVSAGGTVTLDQPAGYPANLTLALREARYSDGSVVTTRASGDLALTGPLLDDALLEGEITLDRTEIVIPSSFGINAGVLLDIRHLNPPKDVALTLDRAGLTGDDEPEGPPFNLRLNVVIDAPNRLFIRGRGLDVEMGGRLRLGGSTTNFVPIGQIELIRGRLGILGQRFEFDEGSVVLAGTLNPRILLVAETEVSDGTVILITVAGVATDPTITFTSSPSLPQDEVLALLIFNQNVSELSPIQVAQLAAAAATLAGRGGGGVIDNFRSGAGLANLDITTDDAGTVGVRAGAYLDEKTYLDVETDSLGDSKVTINLDVTDSIRARASVDSDGEGTIGIFFERDY